LRVTKLACLLIVVVSLTGAAQSTLPASDTLPAAATARLDASLAKAKPHAKHVWRDTPPINADGTINGYIEIAKGDHRKWELDMAKNARAIDRMIPESLGGYPINYGFVPQTVSYDGDPFDVLVVGPAIDGGTVVRGVPIGVMRMEDGGVVDSKVVISPLDARGQPQYPLPELIQRQVGDFFNRYKLHEPGASTRVPGWGTREEGIALVRQTHAFFVECRGKSSDCRIARSK
jgi:inorganic pyrophosphatase